MTTSDLRCSSCHHCVAITPLGQRVQWSQRPDTCLGMIANCDVAEVLHNKATVYPQQRACAHHQPMGVRP